MIRKIIMGAILFTLAAGLGSCSRIENSMDALRPRLVANKFFEAWKNREWETLYDLSHPAFMQKVRMQRLSPECRAMSDRELFVYEFRRFQKGHPDMVLRTYEIRHISPYRPGKTTIWVEAVVNGKNRTVPLAIDGVALKIDLTRIR